jgi:hypothetical protein
VHRINAEYDIRQLATALTKMSEIVLDYLGEPPDPATVRIALRDVFGTATIPKELADAVAKKVKSLKPGDRWKALEGLPAFVAPAPEATSPETAPEGEKQEVEPPLSEQKKKAAKKSK